MHNNFRLVFELLHVSSIDPVINIYTEECALIFGLSHFSALMIEILQVLTRIV